MNPEVAALYEEIEELKKENKQLRIRNLILESDVDIMYDNRKGEDL